MDVADIVTQSMLPDLLVELYWYEVRVAQFL